VQYERACFAKGMEVESQLWTSVVLVLENMPWVLVQMKDARNSEARQAALHHKIMTMRLCCCDRAYGYEFVLKARSEPDNPDCLQKAADDLITAVAKHCPATNFSLERFLWRFIT